MERVLIAGCGRIGTQIGIKLSESGYSVWGIRRNGILPSPIHTINADLLTIQSLEHAFDYIIYCAAPKQYSSDAYQATYLNGLKNLISTLPKRPKKFIFTSSTAVYAQHEEEWVNEESDTKPTHFAGQHLLAAENLLLEQNFPAIILRFSGIYGAEHDLFLKQILNRTTQLSNRTVIRNSIHSEDCVRILEYAIKENMSTGVYLATDHCPVEKNELIHWIEAQLNLPLTKTITKTLAIRGNKRCSNKKLIESTDFSFKYPSYVEGYETLIATASAIV